ESVPGTGLIGSPTNRSRARPAELRRRALRHEALDVAYRLPQPLAVLDQRDAHIALAVFAEAQARRHRHLGVAQEQLRELDAAEIAEALGDRRPGEHRGPRQRHVPTGLRQPLDQHVAPLAVALAHLVDAV